MQLFSALGRKSVALKTDRLFQCISHNALSVFIFVYSKCGICTLSEALRGLSSGITQLSLRVTLKSQSGSCNLCCVFTAF